MHQQKIIIASSKEAWPRLRPLLDRALELEGSARKQFVDSLQGDDAALREDLIGLLAQYDRLGQETTPDAMQLAAPLVASSLEDEAALDQARIGQQIGPYELVQLLGAGGMGAVYLAERSEDGFTQHVALKVVRQSLGSVTAAERFERERQILAGLKHPGIALLFDGGRTPEGQAFYTMEYVEGESITDYCQSHLSTVTERVRLLLQVATALAYAHQNLIVHRDIKPSNVLVTPKGQVKLVDFGLAKLLDTNRPLPTMTQAGLGPMTPAYAAPEQFHNGTITVATDIYQFGVLCFVILTGRLPYRVDPSDSLEWARAVTEQEPMTLAYAAGIQESEAKHSTSARQRRHLTRDLDAIVRKALAKSGANRYRSMDAMIADLEAFLDGRPVTARRAGPLYFTWRFVQRWRYAVAATVLAFALLAATTLIAVRQSHIASAEADRANAVASFLVSLFQVSDPGVNRGEKLTANQILERGAERIDKEMASQPEQRARLQSIIGEVYIDLGDLARARAVLDSAIATLRATPSADPIDLAHALNWASYISIVQGDFKGALNFSDQAESVLDQSTMRRREELASVHSRRAAALDYLGNYNLASREYEASLNLREQDGLHHTVRTAGIHNNFGNLLRRMNDLKRAQTEYSEALAIFQSESKADSQQDWRVAGTGMNLGIVLIDRGRLVEARSLLERASTTFHNQAPSSIGYANAEDKLGEIDRLERKFDLAFSHYETAERVYRSTLGDHAPSVATPIQHRGQAEIERGQYEAALVQFEKALALRAESLPHIHRDVAESLDGRAQALLGLGRLEDAKRDAEEALAIWHKVLPADHPLIVYSLLHVGLVRFAQNDINGAHIVWKEALDLAPSAFADNPIRLNQIRTAINNPVQLLTSPVPAGSYD